MQLTEEYGLPVFDYNGVPLYESGFSELWLVIIRRNDVPMLNQC